VNNRQRVLLASACALGLAAEAYVLFADDTSTFSIVGRQRFGVTDFGEGKPMAHAFLMRGDGLNAVGVEIVSDRPTVARIHWRLWRGMADVSPMTLAAEGDSDVPLGARINRVTFPVVRDGSSKDRWYTFEIQMTNALPRDDVTRPTVAMMASGDNPDRGGVLWIDGQRKAGSLVLHAQRTGRTLYRRFVAEVQPKLRAPLRNPVVQWAFALWLHAAFVTFAYTIVFNRQSQWDSSASGDGCAH
jgi:hypothetical protein